MCGIVGVFDADGKREVDVALLNRMNESQHHRGPDGGGLHTEGGLGLGHRRLSIIDVAGGKQPLYSNDKSLVVVYNGEIYNFRQLRKELEARGHHFVTRSDTEVIVYAWREWGERCVDHFRGMFAFAIWDSNQRTLFLARDRLGIKPLYYTLLPNGWFLFSSELKGILICPDVDRKLDPEAIEDYFAYGYVPDPRTIFENIYKLPPAHTLLVHRGERRIAPVEYWRLTFSNSVDDSERSIEEELICRLRESVEIRLMSEVPLGAFLSGGVDSSAVVAMMSQISSASVNTCSISFGDPKYDESHYAAQVADRYRTEHTVRQVDPGDYELIDTLATLYDEPYADSSALPTYRVCELARQNVTVALSGDGGDENMAGYDRYRWHLYEEYVRSVVPRAIRKPLFGLLGRIYPKVDWAPKVFRAKSTFEGCARDSIDGYFHTVNPFANDIRDRLFSREFRQELHGYSAMEVLRYHAARACTNDALSLVQYLDFKTYLPGDILTKVDRASMAHSLEVRVPFLDHELVEWIATLRPSVKLNGREGKFLLKKALEPHLPNEVLYRPKMGFAVPLASWFRGALQGEVREFLLGTGIRSSGIFDDAFLERLVREHQSGIRDHSAPLWSLMMFVSFQRQVLLMPDR